MAERLVIGLYSPAQQSGKSTVADMLKGTYGFSVRAFARAFKDMLYSLMRAAGIPYKEAERYATEAKEEPIPELGGKSYRYLTQTIGSEWGRQLIDKDLWVNLIVRGRNLPPLVVVEDLRFPNEYEAIRAEGGQVWRIERPGQVPSNEHPSEGLLEGYEFDEQITNDGSVEDLLAKVQTALTGAV